MLGIQLAFSPAIGHWSDKVGRRPAIIATTVAALFSSFFLWPVQVWGYVVNRTAKGGTNGLYAVLRSAVVDITEKEALIKYSGALSFIVGSGTIIGPMFGALLLLALPEARDSARPTVVMILILCGLNIGLALLFKETNDKPKEKVIFGELKEKALNALKIKVLWQQLTELDQKVPGLKSIFILNLLGTLGFGYYGFLVAFLTQSDLNMEPLDTAYFFLYFGGLSCVTNLVFYRYIVGRINKRKAIIGIVLLGIVVQVLYAFSASSVTLLYVVAGVDALSLSVVGGLIGSVLTKITKAGGGQGEDFGNIQGLGGLASFATALANTMLAGVSLRAPFIFCALSWAVVAGWAMRLPDDAKKYTDKIGAEEPEEEEPQAAKPV